jgi:ferredoxin, 2Fe-2S
MPKIVIDNLFGKVLEVTEQNKTVLQHFQDNQIDWMHSCGGKGRCTTCKVCVIAGLTSFSPLTAAEERYIQVRALNSNERLTCQARIHDDIIVKAPEEYKLPHMRYSS